MSALKALTLVKQLFNRATVDQTAFSPRVTMDNGRLYGQLVQYVPVAALQLTNTSQYYNSKSKPSVGYAVKTTDDWCDIFVTTVFQREGLSGF